MVRWEVQEAGLLLEAPYTDSVMVFAGPVPGFRISGFPAIRPEHAELVEQDGRSVIAMHGRAVPVKLAPGAVLWDFIRIGERPRGSVQKDALRFVRRYGPLARQASVHEHGDASRLIEPVSAYEYHAAMMRGLLEISGDIAGGAMPKIAQWRDYLQASRDVDGACGRKQTPSKGAHHAEGTLARLLAKLPTADETPISNFTRQEQGVYMAQTLTALLEDAGLRLRLAYGLHGFEVSVEGSPGMVGAVWYTVVRRTVEVLTRPGGSRLFRCTECRALHERERAPRENARGLCPDCRRHANTERVRRHRAGGATEEKGRPAHQA